MAEKKFNLKSAVQGAGKNASEFFDKAKDVIVRSTDQNDDGKFDKEDISAIADSVSGSVKNSAQAFKDNVAEKSRQNELKRLQPIFIETIDSTEFLMPKFVRITERDKKYSESDVCKGSIGYFSDHKGFKVVNIFSDSIEPFAVSFYPDRTSEFYYVDPTDRDRYIALDEYFGYLKEERISELQMIAQSLGAKHFKVTYKEEKASFTQNNAKGSVKATGVSSAEAEHSYLDEKYSTFEIAAESDYPGHEPVMPQLKYMQRDPSIKTLVAMRMDPASPLSHQKFMLKMSNSSGIKESDAVKIDAVLKGLKISGNASVVSEAKNESRRYLEYEIDF